MAAILHDYRSSSVDTTTYVYSKVLMFAYYAENKMSAVRCAIG